ncbi:LuxR C-terminal-related transcriptional regulator [Actinocrinis sp.]|uniref:LuxR C-terminal-related transcriptional regulator n=1 Tax=Actinocrinis sp. TaxID=1920516 RepID=UPI002D54803F|nr:LuxR C-terminal-related transcriptional regulator [Actinocrinis sp.]HZP51661.1 LuxR C-terminal-related transcriptional regulator [Actinocrinis sp.]
MQDLGGTAASLYTARSRPEADSRQRRPHAFDEPILRLLLNGVPDKAIAARLQVSERTVQRHVRVLLAKVGAHNRMQLGQILACRARKDGDPDVSSQPQAQVQPQPQPQRLNEFDTQILKMLLQGQAESAIAETLNVSRRTVQRCVKGMMSRAGAANRVQLGWYAQRSGWI